LTDLELTVREQLARIEREHAHSEQLRADAVLKMQDFNLNIRRVYLSAVMAAAAILGAGAAIRGVAVTLLGRLH
jgi:hypothetical protein